MAAAGRGGSSIACNPVKTSVPANDPSSKATGSTVWPVGHGEHPQSLLSELVGGAQRRGRHRGAGVSPSAAISSPHSSSTRSTAPFTRMTDGLLSTGRCSVAMYWRSELNGMAANSRERGANRLAVQTRLRGGDEHRSLGRIADDGSTFRRTWLSRASLHAAPASNVQRSAAVGIHRCRLTVMEHGALGRVSGPGNRERSHRMSTRSAPSSGSRSAFRSCRSRPPSCCPASPPRAAGALLLDAEPCGSRRWRA